MIEEDAVAGIHAVGLAVVDRDPVGIELGHGVGRARIERRFFSLGNFLDLAVKLGGGGLVEPGLFLKPQNADGLQHPQGAQGVGIGRVFRRFKGDRHMALGRQIVDLVRLHLLDDPDQVGGIGQIAIVQNKPPVLFMRILVEVIDPVGVEQGGPSLDAVHLIAFFQQKFSQVGAVLTGDSGNECFFHSG